ncbi:hypothetical protein C8N36_13221 [Pelagimonas varians]|uniref:Uncharacterized protein n=1 Tax=Pelagimonas varians TaxID=696760 RepID=A0A238L6A0_9RHOB|nr:hypothetical protein C8N36_13221 [Pelagimonas varians]SMX50351.1 hypothetical protein PEV8663_04608 [Pelagimonas varians]
MIFAVSLLMAGVMVAVVYTAELEMFGYDFVK